MKKLIDLKNWKRNEHFQFFSSYNEPFFGITAPVDCSTAYQLSKNENISFFIYYMFRSLQAANAVEEFHCRIEDGKPVFFDVIHGSTTTLNANDLFAFAHLEYDEDFDAFYRQAKASIDHVKSLKNMNIDENSGRLDVIHYSTIPWISFTGLSHERNFSRPDSIPKIAFGKFFKENEKMLLPVSVHAHHGLMDGLHVGQFFELFQEFLNRKSL